MRHLYTEKNICAEGILQNLIECGIITETDATKSIMDRKRKEIIETHKQEHTIWEKNGKWITCVKDAAGKSVVRRRNSLEELADFLIDYYDS